MTKHAGKAWVDVKFGFDEREAPPQVHSLAVRESMIFPPVPSIVEDA